MRDNIEELPGFLERVAPVQPDLFYSRHLFVFHEPTREQSIRDRPDLANGTLAAAHDLLVATRFDPTAPRWCNPRHRRGAASHGAKHQHNHATAAYSSIEPR
jgi:hypothetical protein